MTEKKANTHCTICKGHLWVQDPETGSPEICPCSVDLYKSTLEAGFIKRLEQQEIDDNFPDEVMEDKDMFV